MSRAIVALMGAALTAGAAFVVFSASGQWRLLIAALFAAVVGGTWPSAAPGRTTWASRLIATLGGVAFGLVSASNQGDVSHLAPLVFPAALIASFFFMVIVRRGRTNMTVQTTITAAGVFLAAGAGTWAGPHLQGDLIGEFGIACASLSGIGLVAAALPGPRAVPVTAATLAAGAAAPWVFDYFASDIATSAVAAVLGAALGLAVSSLAVLLAATASLRSQNRWRGYGAAALACLGISGALASALSVIMVR